MWGNGVIIESIHPPANADELRAKEEDRLILTWEQRRWVRGRYTTERGRKIGVALPTGTKLPHRTILYVGPDWYLKIEAAVEPVLEITVEDRNDAVKLAFEIGNRHFPLALEGDKFLVPEDKAMVRLMERLGFHFERRQAIFDPIGSTQSHQHESFS